ncbi:ALF repeat-containing protein [Cellulomonas sp. KH9]|uniref:ALF repeat-containing protein n=1 Tax=Cellulomonas sp. KH9 TaxID=1855324 RepID=UPI0015A5646B|nr:ALF repeat-containing protein [Cellulomonas sp. KH9]
MRELMRSLLVAVVLVVAGLGIGALPAAADEAADHRAFVLAGFTGTTDDEYRAWVEALAGSPDGPALSAAATRALAGPDEDLRAFVDGGYLAAFHADERIRLSRLISTATEPYVDAGVQRALASDDPAVWTEFLTNGLRAAQVLDDRLAAARILDVITQESSPVLWQATQTALAGPQAALREFIVNGQFVARATDAANAAAAPAPAAPAPAAPAPAPAAPAPGAPAAAPSTAAPARATARPVQLAATGVPGEIPLALLAASSLAAGTGLLVLSRRRRAV